MMPYILLFCLALVCSCAASPETSGGTNQTEISCNHFISTVRLPDQLELCGEIIPLNDPEVRERAEREFYMLLQQPGQIVLYMKRSGRYFPIYEKQLKEASMPDDLKYLSVAESALFMARSSKGAVGLWQLMEGTARALGLTVNDEVDERKNPEKSTQAALQYLKQGFSAHKSWLLTLAGYNMGHTGVKNNREFQDADSYFDLFLNEETSRFIFRIAIIKEFMANPVKYGFDVPKSEYYKPDFGRTVNESGAVSDLAQWAKQNGTSYKDVKLLNPWILGRKLSSPKGGSYQILIPAK